MKRPKPPDKGVSKKVDISALSEERSFAEVVAMIQAAEAGPFPL